MNFSMFSLQPFLSIRKPNTVSKRAQERRTGEKPVVAKPKPASMISRSLRAKHPPTFDSGRGITDWVGILDFTRTERLVRDGVENSTSSSPAWHRGDSPFSSAERSVREMNQRSTTGKPVRGIQNPLAEVKLDHHNLQVPDNRYIEEVFANVRPKLNRLEGDQMLDQMVLVFIWGLFVSTTMKATIHLGEIYNSNFDALKTLFDITQKLVLN